MEKMLIAVLFVTCIAVTSIAHFGGIENPMSSQDGSPCIYNGPIHIEKKIETMNESSEEKFESVFSERFGYDLEFAKMQDWDTVIIRIINETGETVDELRVKRLNDENGTEIAQTFKYTSDDGEQYGVIVHAFRDSGYFGAQWVNVTLSRDERFGINGFLFLGERLLQKREFVVIG